MVLNGNVEGDDNEDNQLNTGVAVIIIFSLSN